MTHSTPNPDSSPLPFALGEVLAGKYRVESILGEGGMGVVLRATHIDLERPVAVKVIRREMAGHEQSASRLMLEARAAAKIRSEHAGKVLDVGRLDTGEPYIVMEFLEGYDLSAYLRQRGALSATEAVDLLLQACDALVQAHDAQIVHRDLKPENLFLSPMPDGSHFVKVLDFGISKDLSAAGERSLTAPQAAIGSPQYMAPEQMEGQRVDPRSDVWALGVILYEMLTGGPAFDGETLAAVCVKVLAAEPRRLEEAVPGLSVGLCRVVHHCLQKQRDARPKDVRTLVAALASFGGPASRVLERRILGTTRLDTADVLGGTAPLPSELRNNMRGYTPPKASDQGIGETVVFAPVDAVPRVISVGTLDAAPSSRTVSVNRSLSRTPIFIVMGAIVGLGVLMFWIARGTSMHTRGPGEALAPSGDPAIGIKAQGAALSTLTQAHKSATEIAAGTTSSERPEPNSSLSAATGTAPSPQNTASAELAPAITSAPVGLDTPPKGTTLNAAPARSAANNPTELRGRVEVRPASPKQGSKPSRSGSEPAPSAAWNTNNFGGRQ